MSRNLYVAARRTVVGAKVYPGGIYASEDGGVTWTAVTNLPIGKIAVLTPHPANPNRLLVGTTGVGIIAVDF